MIRSDQDAAGRTPCIEKRPEKSCRSPQPLLRDAFGGRIGTEIGAATQLELLKLVESTRWLSDSWSEGSGLTENQANAANKALELKRVVLH